MEKLDKKTYRGIVKFTLESMVTSSTAYRGGGFLSPKSELSVLVR